MSGHTPGPWRADKHLGCKRIMGRKAPGRQGQYSTEVCSTPGLMDEDEDKANALLIAAVTELLEAAKRCVSRMEEVADDLCEGRVDRVGVVVGALRLEADRASAAIAKAEGSAD